MRLGRLLCTIGLVAVPLACGSDEGSGETVGLTTWSTQAPAEGTDFDIAIDVGSSSCDSLERVVVDETSDAVTIEAFVRNTGDDACTADFVVEIESISLESPLGDRELLGCDRNLEPGSSERDCRLPGG